LAFIGFWVMLAGEKIVISSHLYRSMFDLTTAFVIADSFSLDLEYSFDFFSNLMWLPLV
jgi:hypothetical protein